MAHPSIPESIIGVRPERGLLPRGTISALRSQVKKAWLIRTGPVRFLGAWIELSTVSGGEWAVSSPVALPKKDEAQEHIDEFYRRKAELLADYEGKYVAFRDGKVLDSDLDRLTLARRFYGKYGYVPACIAKVSAETRVVRAPIPRRRR